MCPDSCEYNLKEKHFHCIWVCIKVFNCGAQYIMSSSPGRVKPKIIKLVFVPSPLKADSFKDKEQRLDGLESE